MRAKFSPSMMARYMWYFVWWSVKPIIAPRVFGVERPGVQCGSTSRPSLPAGISPRCLFNISSAEQPSALAASTSAWAKFCLNQVSIQ